MVIPPKYTPVQITVPDDRKCISVYHIWKTIYYTNQDTYSYISHLSLARKYNLIYALIKTDGTQIWLKNGSSHRDNDLPALIYSNGTKYWYKDGELHRDNDLPAAIYEDGTQEYYQNGVQYDYPS